MATYARLSGDRTSTAAVLQLAALTEAVAELRQAQQRAAQARAALTAAQQLARQLQALTKAIPWWFTAITG